MKAGSTLLLLAFWQMGPGPSSGTQYMRWERTVALTGNSPACAVLDANVFAHAAPSLKDMRVYADGREVPYGVTMSQAAEPEGDPARILNLSQRGGEEAFDLEMPDRAYTDVVLDLAGRDYRVTASVSGMDDLKSPARKELGSFELFDMSSKGLARDTTLPLQESRFRFLHVVLRGGSPPVTGVEVPPSRESQTLYTVVARTDSVEQRGTETVAVLRVPARVPIERVLVGVKDGGNFSRPVRVTARADGPAEVVEGTILRVRMGALKKETMAFPASLGANLQGDATVEAALQNGTAGPLPVEFVALEMRERRVCFPTAGREVRLFYGDPGLPAPVYAGGTPGGALVRLGEERENPGFRVRHDERGFWAKHREMVWLGAMVLTGLAGTVGLRMFRRS